MLQFIITDSVRWKSRTVAELYDESTLCCVKYDDSCAERSRKSLDFLLNDNESEE